MSLARRPYGYTKMDKEDKEEQNHRKAQFLIYKVMEQADSLGRQSSLRVKMCRLKVKIGRRLEKLRKGIVFTISKARLELRKQIMIQYFKNLKRLLCSTNRRNRR